MEFKSFLSKKIIFSVMVVIFMMVVIVYSFLPKIEIPAQEDPIKPLVQDPPAEVVLNEKPELDVSKDDEAAVQQQLERDRQEQKETNYLKIKLEQTNLELEEQKDIAQINRLKLENIGNFKEPALDGQKNLPEVRVMYIGGGGLKKEAILSIGGVSFQVKEKSSPLDNIQVLSISDSSVTLHFSSPQDLTKIIEYKPE